MQATRKIQSGHFSFTNPTTSSSQHIDATFIFEDFAALDNSDAFLRLFARNAGTSHINDSFNVTRVPVIDILCQKLMNELKNVKYNSVEAGTTSIQPESIKYSLLFIELLQSSLNSTRAIPYIDVHSDGEISLVWQNKKVGVLTISFSPTGYIIYGGYFPNETQQPKGRLHFTKKTELLKIIKRFE